MLTVRQVTNRSLECVWVLSNNELVCRWVERPHQVSAQERRQKDPSEARQKVA